jgi:predicted MFS family arabinose efflux permease
MRKFASTAQARLATRLAFFAAGFSMASCAPLVPFIKQNVAADERQFGLLLLCFGVGSLLAMPVVGLVSARHGPRSMVLLGGFGLVIFLPALTIAQTPFILAAALFLFGASLGTIDVAMNLHGVAVEAQEKRSLMSSFHAQFSLGGLCGAGLITLLLSVGVSLTMAALVAALVTLVAMVPTVRRLLWVSSSHQNTFVWPHGIVILLGFLAAIMFLVEGAVLDWGALLVIDRQLAAPKNAGIGYILFSAAMVVARLTGDRIVGAVGEYWMLISGGMLTILGIAVILLSNLPLLALSGFVLMGLGAANLVPIFFSAAGRQKIMPPGLAIAAVTTAGYAGVLVGPAMIGFAADIMGLSIAFWWLALLIALVPLSAYLVVKH